MKPHPSQSESEHLEFLLKNLSLALFFPQGVQVYSIAEHSFIGIEMLTLAIGQKSKTYENFFTTKL